MNLALKTRLNLNISTPSLVASLIVLITLTSSVSFATVSPTPPPQQNSNGCERLLSGFYNFFGSSRVEKEHQVNALLEDLQKLGATELVNTVRSGRTKIVYRAKRFPWQSDVSWSLSWLGGRKLIIRSVHYEDEKTQQLRIWQIASALYEVDLQQKLFSRASLKWHGDRALKLVNLQAELYVLIENLETINWAKELQKLDKAWIYWYLGWFTAEDPTDRTRVNLKDLDLYRSEGESAWRADVLPRFRNRALWSHYTNHVKRLAYGLLALQLATTVPQMMESRSYFDTSIRQNSSLADERLMVRRLKDRLDREIQERRNQISPDTAELDRLMKDRDRLVQENPWILRRTIPGPAM